MVKKQRTQAMAARENPGKDLEQKLQNLTEAYAKLARNQKERIQAEKLAAVALLASGVAHELNNPLTTIMGLIDLLLQDAVGAEERADLQTIKEQGERCRRIINNLLRFAGKCDLEKVPAQVNDLVEKALDQAGSDLKRGRIKVSKKLTPGLPLLSLDPGQIQQVFIQIITNARHAMEGVPKPTLKIATAEEGGRVRICIADNGCGIPSYDLDRIFDPFLSTKEVGKGTGLGLSSSYGIVQAHGGRIHVESKVGKGTRFCIDL